MAGGLQWVLCDYGGVLSEMQPRDSVDAMAKLCGLDTSVFEERYWKRRAEYDRADLTVEEYWTDLLDWSPSSEEVTALDQLDVSSWLWPNDDSMAAIANLVRPTGVGLAILSNAPASLARRLQHIDWLGDFMPKFFSCDLRLAKPDRRIFEVVVSELGSRPDEIAFLDDRIDNVEAATTSGLMAFHFEEARSFDWSGMLSQLLDSTAAS